MRLLFACVFLLSVFQQGVLAQKAASHVVGGTVTNEKGELLQGVVVEVKDTKTRTLTDASGKFSISIKDKNAVLVISYTGYTDKEVENLHNLTKSSYMNLNVFGPKKAIVNGTLSDWTFDKTLLKDTEKFDTYWDEGKSVLKLGDFNQLVNFLITYSGKAELIDALKK